MSSCPRSPAGWQRTPWSRHRPGHARQHRPRPRSGPAARVPHARSGPRPASSPRPVRHTLAKTSGARTIRFWRRIKTKPVSAAWMLNHAGRLVSERQRNLTRARSRYPLVRVARCARTCCTCCPAHMALRADHAHRGNPGTPRGRRQTPARRPQAMGDVRRQDRRNAEADHPPRQCRDLYPSRGESSIIIEPA